MSKFLSRAKNEKGKTVGALKKLEALIHVNLEKVFQHIY